MNESLIINHFGETKHIWSLEEELTKSLLLKRILKVVDGTL